MRFITTLFYVVMLLWLVVVLLATLSTNPGHQSKPWTERQLFWVRLVTCGMICIGVLGLAACGGGRDTDERMERIYPPPPPCDINREHCK